MIHLRHTKGITNPHCAKAESFFLSDALDLGYEVVEADSAEEALLLLNGG
jgi:hypothetical protein